MHALLSQTIRPALQSSALEREHDGAFVDLAAERLAFTTDSYVIQPLFFPGGDIGRLAVFGTVNDLAMCGATPRVLSLSLILEEGFPLSSLERIMASIAAATQETETQIITGDTKVIERGRGDGLYINTAGIGAVAHTLPIGPQAIQAGDAILLSGDIGRHGIAVMAQREHLHFESSIVSDLAPLHRCVQALLEAKIQVRCLRDLTRGGLATALFELATTSHTQGILEQDAIPIHPQVQAACELLGLDPLYVANEGRFVAIVPAAQADAALTALHATEHASDARRIGTFHPPAGAPLKLQNAFGTQRILSLQSGEQLPRIC